VEGSNTVKTLKFKKVGVHDPPPSSFGVAALHTTEANDKKRFYNFPKKVMAFWISWKLQVMAIVSALKGTRGV